jgi:hypothetical protein
MRTRGGRKLPSGRSGTWCLLVMLMIGLSLMPRQTRGEMAARALRQVVGFPLENAVDLKRNALRRRRRSALHTVGLPNGVLLFTIGQRSHSEGGQG